jgi:AraC-like DNA-binding protein
MNANAGFHRWHHRVRKAERHMVFPDGCRDVLIVRVPDGPARIVLTEFDFRPRAAALTPGTEITGYRLRPGAHVSPQALEAVAAKPDQAETVLGDECGDRSDLDDAIAALTVPGTTVETASRGLGVSIRTMQRHFLSRKLPPPDFWRLLARARRAAGMLSFAAPLAETADECGFSDQAHMTRDLVRWFGLTPARLRRNASLLNVLRQPALGNWTGEQISTR